MTGPFTTGQPWYSASDKVNARPELVFGLVGALGTDLAPLAQDLQSALRSVGYRSEVIRLSDLFADLYARSHPDHKTTDPHMAELMRQGDELRAIAGNDAAIALGITRLRNQRRRTRPDGDERNAFATIFRSIKHKDEVATLREVYGPRFVLIGGWAPRKDRAVEVERRLRADHPGRDVGWYAQQKALLMARDEQDEASASGQGVRDAFELADVYVAIRPGQSTSPRMARLVRLLFGAPFETPTRFEQAMFLASGAALRSSAAGRQVGVVVVDEDGEVLVTGVNEAPRAHGGQYWADELPDHRDFTYGADVNDRLRTEVVSDLLSRLNQAGWLSDTAGAGDLDGLARRAMTGPLRSSRVGDLLEFGRIAHAEMAAICTAARRGTPLKGAIMCSTTYPCHECARLIIASGIRKVVYIDPYPKSQVQEMFRDEVSEGPCLDEGAVVFEPFEGVAPRLFRQVFEMPTRSRDKVTGQYDNWDGTSSPPRLLVDSVIPPLQPMEGRVTLQFTDRIRKSSWRRMSA